MAHHRLAAVLGVQVPHLDVLVLAGADQAPPAAPPLHKRQVGHLWGTAGGGSATDGWAGAGSATEGCAGFATSCPVNNLSQNRVARMQLCR